jgi:hypothetical protein
MAGHETRETHVLEPFGNITRKNQPWHCIKRRFTFHVSFSWCTQSSSSEGVRTGYVVGTYSRGIRRVQTLWRGCGESVAP